MEKPTIEDMANLHSFVKFLDKIDELYNWPDKEEEADKEAEAYAQSGTHNG